MDYIQEVEEYTENIFLIKLDTLVKGYDGKEIGCSNQQAQELANRTKWLKSNLELLDENTKKSIDSLIEKDKDNLAALNEKLETVITQVKGIDTQVNTINTQIKSIDKEISGVNTQIKGINTQIKEVSTEVKEVAGQVKTINTNVQEANKQLKEDIDYLNTALSETKKSIIDAEVTVDGLINDLNKKVETTNKRIDSLSDDLNEKIKTNKANIDTNKKGIATNKQDIANLANSLNKEIDKTNTLEKTLNIKIDNTNKSVTTISQNLDKEIDKTNQINKDLITESNKTDKLNTDVTKLNDELSSLNDRLNNVNSKIDQIEGTAWQFKSFNNAKKGDFYFFNAPDNYLKTYIQHHFYKYYYKNNYKNAITRKYTGSVLSSLIKNETLYTDKNGTILADKILDVTLDKTSPFSYHYKELDYLTTKFDLTGIRIVIDPNSTSDAIFPLNSDSDANRFKYSLFSVQSFSNFNPYKLFSNPLDGKSAANVPAYQYWSAANYFSSYKTDVYIGIVLDNPRFIQGYKIQCIDKFVLSASTLAKSWRFEATTSSNPTGANWVVLDTQTNVDLSVAKADTDGFKTFKIKATNVKYRSIRLVITDVQNPSARPSLSRLNVIASAALLLEDSKNTMNYYTFDGKGNLSTAANFKYNTINGPEINRVLNEKGFYDSGLFKTNNLSDITKYRLTSSGKAKISIYLYGRKVQLRIDKNIETNSYALLSINKLKINLAKGAAFNAKIALIAGDNSWYSYNNNKWVKILTNPEAQYSYDKIAPMLYDSGMNLNTFNNIPEDAIIKFISDLSGNTPSLSVAYATDNKLATDPVVPDNLTITYGNYFGYEAVYKESIKLKFLNKRMIIEVIEDGNYELLYTFFDRNV